MAICPTTRSRMLGIVTCAPNTGKSYFIIGFTICAKICYRAHSSLKVELDFDAIDVKGESEYRMFFFTGQRFHILAYEKTALPGKHCVLSGASGAKQIRPTPHPSHHKDINTILILILTKLAKSGNNTSECSRDR